MRRALAIGWVVLVAGGCAEVGPPEPAPGAETRPDRGEPTRSRTISGGGLRGELPPGWDGEVVLRTSGVPYLRAGTLPLPRAPRDVPEDPAADPTLALLEPDDVYVILEDVTAPLPEGRPWDEPSGAIAVRRADLVPTPPTGLSLAARYLILGERAFVLRVWFGDPTPGDDALAEANGLLGTVVAGPWRPDGCPSSWPGPWTACPEAAWVRRVAEHAGFRAVGDTGSALVFAGRGLSFYLHATRAPRLPVGSREWFAGRAAGVAVHDSGVRLWWRVRGFVFWLTPGPLEGARHPEAGELEPLVRAARAVTPPRP